MRSRIGFAFRLGWFYGADSCILRFPSQKRTVLVRKPYVFGTDNVRFWDGNRKMQPSYYTNMYSLFVNGMPS